MDSDFRQQDQQQQALKEPLLLDREPEPAALPPPNGDGEDENERAHRDVSREEERRRRRRSTARRQHINECYDGYNSSGSISTVVSSSSSTGWKSEEAGLFLRLAVPTVGIQLGLSVPGFLVAAFVGRHYGYLFLDGFALANLTGNLFALSVLQGLLSAADTLGPRAFAARNFQEVGAIAVRACVGGALLLLPPAALLALFLRPLLVAVGVSPDAAQHAAEWYRIYALSLPFSALYAVVWKFLAAARRSLAPLVGATALSCGLVLPAALAVLPRFLGFRGTAAAVVVHQAFQVLLVLAWLKVRKLQSHDTDTGPCCWPGIGTAWREALRWKPFWEFMRLGLGGILASSGWIYWEVIALIVGSSLGAVSLGVHAIPTSVLSVLYMVPKGIGIALSVRLSSLLAVDASKARQLVRWTVAICLALIASMTAAMYFGRFCIFRLFTDTANDGPEVLEGAERIWTNVCAYFFVTAVFGVNMGIAIGMGLQWVQGTALLATLWLLGLPLTYHFAVALHGGIDAVWTCLWPPYLVIDIVMTIVFVSKDWTAITERIRQRESETRFASNDGDSVDETSVADDDDDFAFLLLEDRVV